MITAVDTSVLLDVFADSPFGAVSREALREALGRGSLMACDVVWAEIAAHFPKTEAAEEAIRTAQIQFAPIDASVALAAGEAWRAHRGRGGRRERIVADFLIGAHASLRADRLLTRDRGFYRTYFTRLRVIDPSES